MSMGVLQWRSESLFGAGQKWSFVYRAVLHIANVISDAFMLADIRVVYLKL